MAEVIPTIIARDYQELEDKVRKVERYAEWAQLDIMDGKFVDNLTWPYSAGALTDLKKLKTNLNLEAHLMTRNPEKIISRWLDLDIKRIIFHYESTSQPNFLIKQIKQSGLEAGMAINPETPISVFEPLAGQLDLFLIMTVTPGQGGQEFIPESLIKISALREKYPKVKIEVDGGINPATARLAVEAGADLLASGSAVFGSPDITETIKQMESF